MFNSARTHAAKSPQPARRGRRSPRRAVVVGVLVGCLAIASLAATVLAASTALSIGSAPNATLGKQVVINVQGRTLYSLHPETTRHLLCKSKACFKFWPPVTVASSTTKLKAGSGVQGHLGILRRSGGLLQVTLRGMPLYRFANDHAKGQANGEGIKGFGGTWHAVSASSGATSKSVAPTTPMPSPPSTPSPPAPYPAY
jgi:predicted lipoprotein with Yx(FWY)xxD motif